MRNLLSLIMAAFLLIAALPAAAERETRQAGKDQWRGHEIGRFAESDLDIWRRGRWYHGAHEGRPGWWWLAAGMWYLYPAPVYPYPDPYAPPLIVSPPEVAGPPGTVPPKPRLPENPQFWYYCESAQGYFPYVSSCPEAWHPVPAKPFEGERP